MSQQPVVVIARSHHKNPTMTELREWSKEPSHYPIGGEPFVSEVFESQSGSMVYTTKVRSRSKHLTYIVEHPQTPLGVRQQGISSQTFETLKNDVLEYLKSQEIIELDRQMGQGGQAYACKLYITRPFARIAYMWHNTMSDLTNPVDKNRPADFTSIYVPEWPTRLIVADMAQNLTLILGTDYLGEAKKSFLRMAMYRVKQEGGLGLHAGSKELLVKNKDGQLDRVGLILFGLSGTGKTTLTLHHHDLKAPEKAIVRQDDVILMEPNGTCRGTEQGFFIKTEGLTPDGQEMLFKAAMSAHATFENVAVPNGSGGVLDFTDYRYSTNGRGIVLRSDIEPQDPNLDLAMAHKIIFITRRNTILPAVAKLTPQQAAASFMLGESIETSAGDPKRAGQPKRSVGTNPFIVGPESEEGNRMMAFIQANPKIEAYLLNTGSIGEKRDSQSNEVRDPGYKIKITDSATIMKELARNTIEWTLDPISGYEIPTFIPGLEVSMLDPRSYYTRQEYETLYAQLRHERLDWIEQFSGLDPAIKAAILA